MMGLRFLSYFFVLITLLISSSSVLASRGSAGCYKFTPSVVQCYNRGSNGMDTQWECKAQMDNQIRFGKVEVTCEGYDYPDDPYVLAGSCGLEYTLDQVKGSGSSYDPYSATNWKSSPSNSGGFQTLLFMVVAGVVVYAFYKTCIASEHMDARSRTSDDFSNRPPPPPGFRSEYYPSGGGSGGGSGSSGYSTGNSGSSNDQGDSCSGSSRTRHTGTGNAGLGGGGAGGFWTGAATGGLLGYMFGARNTGGQQYGWGGGPSTSRGWGGGGSSWGGGGGSSGGTSTSSGFGGTRRR